MKKIGLLLAAMVIAVLMTGCSNVMNKTVNTKDFPAVEKKIMNDNSIPAEEKEYIIKNLSEVVGYSELAKALNVEVPADNTFANVITSIREEYANGGAESPSDEIEEVIEEEIEIDSVAIDSAAIAE